MGIPVKRKMSSIVISILLFLFFAFANIYAIRQLGSYAVELFFYDKLLVAYQIAGMPGVNNELQRILTQEKMPREKAIAGVFKKNLVNLRDCGGFLKNIVEEKKNKINFLRKLRNIAFGCIIVLILLRIMIALHIKKSGG